MNFKIALSLLVVVCVGYAVAADNDTTTFHPPNTSTANNATSGSTSMGPHTTVQSTAITAAENTSSSHFESSTTHHTEAPTTKKPSDIWGVQHNGSYCILLQANISIKFRYNSTKNNQFVINPIKVPSSAVASGSCGDTDQSIELRFFNDWSLRMDFHKTNDTTKYYQSNVMLKWALNNNTFADAPVFNGSDNNPTPMFNTSKTGYYCMARMTLYENSSVESGLFGIYTEKLHLEAFQHAKEETFSESYERCKEDTISNLVPIIVGACLGGLIIIVLIAYLIGRKRSRRGYESV